MCSYALHKEAPVSEAYTRIERVSGLNLAVARSGILRVSLLIAVFLAIKCFANAAFNSCL